MPTQAVKIIKIMRLLRSVSCTPPARLCPNNGKRILRYTNSDNIQVSFRQYNIPE